MGLTPKEQEVMMKFVSHDEMPFNQIRGKTRVNLFRLGFIRCKSHGDKNNGIPAICELTEEGWEYLRAQGAQMRPYNRLAEIK